MYECLVFIIYFQYFFLKTKILELLLLVKMFNYETIRKILVPIDFESNYQGQVDMSVKLATNYNLR